jgi:nucleoside-diphosphate-sugar epimerase
MWMMIQESLCEMSAANNKQRKGNFEKLVMDAVENVFSSLGESCKQAIYFHLENRYNIGKKEIPERIEDFADALEEIFGSGAKLIEIEIIKLLFSKVQTFKYSPKQEDLLFTNYLKRLGDS